jgi:protein-tyrosine kinase
MSLIEEAAKRLEHLRSAGVGVPQGQLEAANGSAEHNLLELRASNAKSITGKNPAVTGANQSSRRVELSLTQLAASGFVTPDTPRSQIADEFRVIKRPLIANASGSGAAPVRNGNLIMITSSIPGEGKTFSAINLAMSIAMELDKSVLLVDADVARPALPKLFGLPSSRGLLDVLQDKSIDLSQVLLRTNVEKLSVLLSGTPHERATELLASNAMAALLADMTSRYSDRIIIFDSPPLLVTTEARVLATLMGQIVFVVKAETTLQSQVKDALASIESCPVKMMMLNQISTEAQGAYSYGYGYGYGA